jgi:predicted nucleic acid-binding protein
LSYNRSAYDAADLELAIRLGLPLASIDDGLKAAAGSAGIVEFEP